MSNTTTKAGERRKALKARLARLARKAETDAGVLNMPKRAKVVRELAERLAREAAREGVNPDQAENDVTSALSRMEGRIKAVEDAKRIASLPGAGDGKTPGDTWNAYRVTMSLITGNTAYAPLEWEMHRETVAADSQARACLQRYGLDAPEHLAQGTSPDAKGGILVPKQVRADLFVELARPTSVAEALGVTTVPFTYPTEIPVERTAPGSGAVPENQEAPETEVEWGQLNVRPHAIESYIKISNQLLTQAPAADRLIRRAITREIGLKRGTFILKGTGGVEPLGIKSQIPAVNVVDFAASTASVGLYALYESLRQVRRKLAKAETLDSAMSPGWALAHDVLEMIMHIKNENVAAGAPTGEVTRTIISRGEENRLLGYPYRETGLLDDGADAELIFGDWSQAFVAEFGNLVIVASREAGFRKRQTHLLAYEDIDVVVERPLAFATVENFTTVPLG